MAGRGANSNVITIKKYSNRRLYDMTHSRYLTIDELANLIREGYDVQVIDSKTKDDITQAVLTQVVLERNGVYLFSTTFLHQIIRNRDGILGEFFTDFVPKMLDSYLDTRDAMRRQLSNFTSPWLMGGEMKMPFINPFMGIDPGRRPISKPTASAMSDEEAKEIELARLKAQMQQLQARIEELDR
jgi:polyhydroxyalkanoate synthesis repressor PhaR